MSGFNAGRVSLLPLLLVFCLPFIVIFILLLGEINTGIHATELRMSGMEYEKPLLHLLYDLLRYRTSANAALSTPEAIRKLLVAQQPALDRDVAEVDRVDHRLGPTLHTTQPWSECRAQWIEIRRQSSELKPEAIKGLLDPHTGKVAALANNRAPNTVSLVTLIGEVADNSGLVLESQLDTYCLVHAGITRLPALVTETANISDIGQLILARGSHSVTNEEMRELDLRMGMVRSSETAVSQRIRAADGYNAALGSESDVVADTQQATQRLLHLVTKEFIDTYTVNLEPQQYYGTAQAALASQVRLYDTLSGDLDGLLQAELSGLRRKQRFVEIFAALVLLITAGGFAGFHRGLEARQRAEASLHETEKRNRLIIDNALDAVVGMDEQGCIIDWNPQAEAEFGWTYAEVMGREVSATIVPPRYREAHDKGLKHFLGSGEGPILNQCIEMAALHRDGHEFPIELKISSVRQSDKWLFTAFVSDITERKRAEHLLERHALFDVLTGLPNRTLFMDRLGLAVKRSKRDPEQRFAVLFIDLDQFKVVNDSMGHTVGDQLLVAVARRLETCLRPGDTVARLGGDEFTVLLEDARDLSAATHAAERIQRALAAPFTLNGRPVFVAASIGITGGGHNVSAVDSNYLEALVRDADTAMYRAKAQGRAGYAVFDAAMHEQAVARLHLEADLRQALERGEFETHYQPIMRLDDSRVSGFEALVRWRHPERGLLAPGAFIPVAEETGLIVQLDRWVLRAACRQLAAWQQEFPLDPPLTVSVNLSGRHFAQPDLVAHVQEVLHETQLEPCTLHLEITESAIMDNPQSAASVLQQLQATGVLLSIDDFGTGYSSLSYLHRLPFDTLKIDRSFVQEMNSTDAGEIVRTITTLAHNLKLKVIAEGIETADQAAQLSNLHCEYGQGYFFYKPLDAQTTHSLLAAPTNGVAPVQSVTVEV